MADVPHDTDEKDEDKEKRPGWWRRNRNKLVASGLITVSGAYVGDELRYRYKSTHQPCDISHIECDDDGIVKLDQWRFWRELFIHNDHVVVGNSDHNAEEIPLYLAAHIRTLKEAGVDTICLEFERDQKLQDEPSSANHDIPAYRYLYDQCKLHGVNVVFMDVKIKSEEAKKGAEIYYEYLRKRKQDPKTPYPTEAMSGPEGKAFDRERREANAAWVAYIRERIDKGKKTLVHCGRHHIGNAYGEKDVDELLSDAYDKANCVHVALSVQDGRKDVAIRRNSKPPVVFTSRDEPEFTIEIPKIPRALIQKLSRWCFSDMVKKQKYFLFLQSPADEQAAILARYEEDEKAYTPLIKRRGKPAETGVGEALQNKWDVLVRGLSLVAVLADRPIWGRIVINMKGQCEKGQYEFMANSLLFFRREVAIDSAGTDLNRRYAERADKDAEMIKIDPLSRARSIEGLQMHLDEVLGEVTKRQRMANMVDEEGKQWDVLARGVELMTGIAPLDMENRIVMYDRLIEAEVAYKVGNYTAATFCLRDLREPLQKMAGDGEACRFYMEKADKDPEMDKYDPEHRVRSVEEVQDRIEAMIKQSMALDRKVNEKER